ncbi:MAG TPA: hypothetical protein VE153_04165 [Myxococcus sp.]|jgi:hypothetical protein|nr:hypothetical protein [Myxococcus sp.]
MKLTVEELIARASLYWPADFEWYERGERAPENDRRLALCKQQWQQRGEQWTALVADLRQQLPGYSIHNATAPSEPCFRCSVYLPEKQLKPRLVQVVVGCLSMIAPVYTVYGLQYEFRPKKFYKKSNQQLLLDPLPPEMLAPADVVARRIEARFDAERLTPEVAATPVPLYVDITFPPHATLFHALISEQPTSVP